MIVSQPAKITLTSLLFLGISLFQNAITLQDFDGVKFITASNLFFFGSIAVLGGGLFEWIIWLANPLSLLAVILLFRKKRSAKRFSKVALGLALSFITWRNILASENGREAEIIHLNSGYWLWLLSILILTVGIHRYFKNASSSLQVES